MRCVDMNTIVNLCQVRRPEYDPLNYQKQLFVGLRGHVFRYYITHGKIEREEFAYVHFRKEAPIQVDVKNSNFVIARKGFCELESSDSLIDVKSFKPLVHQYNEQEGALKELLRFLFYTFVYWRKRVLRI